MTTSFVIPGVSRRVFLGTAAAATGAAVLPAWAATAKYTRYNATSPQGQAMLASYAVAIGKMLALPPTNPHNWFRNAFVHAMDCPHGNWWFFTWHRPYTGYFEQVVRKYSGNPNFAFPYWDWTQRAAVPNQMFDGVLDPTNAAYAKYMSSYDTFFKYMNPAMTDYWKGLSEAQLGQLRIRGMATLDSLWTQVKGTPKDGGMFTTTPHTRWLTRAHPELDKNTRIAVNHDTIMSGLAPKLFVDAANVTDGFNSSQTGSHNSQPNRANFAMLEGQPHNLTHNNVGGYGHVTVPLNVGVMADNLSPIDPLFFLHHANMDRLWDVWTRKQKARHLPWLPTGTDWTNFAKDPFLFYIDANGNPAPRKTAGESVEIDGFDYTYQPGSGEEIVTAPPIAVAALAAAPVKPFVAAVSGGAGSVAIPASLLERRGEHALVATITIPRPMSGSAPREYDVLVNAPPGTRSADPDSPYYVATISFFGFMPGMGMGDASFNVPINRLPPVAQGKAPGDLVFTVVPTFPAPATMALTAAPPVLKAVSISVPS